MERFFKRFKVSDLKLQGAWPKSMSPELYFLKYAFPCAFITFQRGRISRSEFEKLEDAAVNNEVVLREDLERIFAPAMRRLKKLSKETGLEFWSRELLEEYYFKNHNKIIEEGEGDYGKAPAVLRELCKIFPATIESSQKDTAVAVLPDGKKRAVNTCLVGSLKPGDRVMIHYGYAAEVLL